MTAGQDHIRAALLNSRSPGPSVRPAPGYEQTRVLAGGRLLRVCPRRTPRCGTHRRYPRERAPAQVRPRDTMSGRAKACPDPHVPRVVKLGTYLVVYQFEILPS